jgi:hypothetical protein
VEEREEAKETEKTEDAKETEEEEDRAVMREKMEEAGTEVMPAASSVQRWEQPSPS